MLTSTACQPLYGKLSDVFGRKTVVLFANVMFMAGSAVSGWATSITMLIAGRAIAGIGAGGLMGMTFVIFSDMLDMRERGKYLGLIGAIYSLSSVLGPLLGGAFTDHVTWRWSFWINLPFEAISMVFIIFNLNLPTPKGSFKEKIKRIDFLGAIVLLAAVVLLLLPLSWGGNTYAWNSGIVIGLLCAGVVMTVIFVLVEWKIPKEPIVPIHLFKIRNIYSTFGGLFFGGMTFFGMLFYLPIYFQVVKQESATIGGLETVPFVIGLSLTALSSGVWVSKRGTYAFFPMVGNIMFAVGSGLCALFTTGTHRVATIFVLFLCGSGMGFTLQASTLSAQAAVKPKHMATITTSVQFFRSLGQVFGVAIIGTVFNNKLKSTLHARFPNDPMILRVAGDSSFIAEYPPEQVVVIYESFVLALHYVFYCCAAFCVVAFVSTCFIQHLELRTNASSEGGAKKIEMVVDMA
ncbi:hypothetical protein BGZ83_010023 [Gryganskiella cystojenkinii]|nr:hypothetical protein BGZ83_010023 [Gryganskiella cystojenkinii]